MTEKEWKHFKPIYNDWLKQNGVSALRTYRNPNSHVDGIYYSGGTDTAGGTDIKFEFKTRRGIFKDHFSSTIIQKDKYDSLQNAAYEIAGRCHYIVEYDDAVFIYDLTNKPLSFQVGRFQSSDKEGAHDENKLIAKLLFTEADFIYSKAFGPKTTADVEKYLLRYNIDPHHIY